MSAAWAAGPNREGGALLEARGVSVSIGDKTLLNDVTLSLEPGSITCLLGPNGAGKSTLLRVMSGALPPSQGEVQFSRRPLAAWEAGELAKVRAVLSQSTHLGFAFTAAEVVALGRSPHARASSAALDRRMIAAAMEAADIGHLASRRYPTLSGGEQQRVQLARVLAQLMDDGVGFDGKLLLLDEPTASLDLAHQQEVMAIARKVADAGGGVLAILHDLNLAASAADMVCLLKQGRLAASGAPVEVLTPAHIAAVFDIRACIMTHPERDLPLVVPLGQERRNRD